MKIVAADDADDRAFRALTCKNGGECCEKAPGEPADWCDACRWDYDCWLDQLAEEGRAIDRMAEGWDLAGGPERWHLPNLHAASTN